MKIFNKIFLVSGISVMLLSCTGELDVQPEGTPTEASFWKTENDLITGANAMYKPLYNEEFYGRGLFWFINASDDMVTGRGKTKLIMPKTSAATISQQEIWKHSGTKDIM
jgi:hypothetical protein